MEPTMLFYPFGSEGPKVALFGKQTGDWNMNRFQKTGDHLSNPGLYFRLGQLSAKFGFKEVFVPKPTDCNTVISNRSDFPISIHNGAGSLIIRRGVRSDGMILFPCSVGAIASADCPTIIAFCPTMQIAIVGHGGSKSLVDVRYIFEGQPPRKYPSVVDAIVAKTRECGFCTTRVFVTCGIRKYFWPKLASHLSHTEVGQRSVAGDIVDLKVLIADQFTAHGVSGVVTDIVDTYDDKDKGNHQWHSYRRGQTAIEKAGRNLILVVNR